MKRLLMFLMLFLAIVIPVNAQTIRWVDFKVPYESLKYAMDVDIATYDSEKHIDVFAFRAAENERMTRYGAQPQWGRYS